MSDGRALQIVFVLCITEKHVYDELETMLSIECNSCFPVRHMSYHMLLESYMLSKLYRQIW